MWKSSWNADVPKETDNGQDDSFESEQFGKICWLDACALLTMPLQEEGAGIVEMVLIYASAGRLSAFIPKFNLLEVYYDIYRTSGRDLAKMTISILWLHR